MIELSILIVQKICKFKWFCNNVMDIKWLSISGEKLGMQNQRESYVVRENIT
jgi:hypothetical protein